MIPLSPRPWQSGPDDWTVELARAVTDVPTLLARLGIAAAGVDVAPTFPVRVPEPFLARMRPGDANDPLLRQVLPLAVENAAVPGYIEDPLREAAATRAPGLIQKYHGRALLVAAPSCAVHCRYCFRRDFPYDEHHQGVGFPSLGAVERDPSIVELILSGGDPLMLKDAVLARAIARFDAITHLRRLRIHTRLPVVIPNRITPALIDALEGSRLDVVVVLHINHANEIGGDLPRALAALHHAGITLLNQSVLLAGVNDDADALIALSEALFDHRVLPYYLHLPDAVRGTAHFAVSVERARTLIDAVARRLPGYLVPRLAREVPGAPYKEIIMSS